MSDRHRSDQHVVIVGAMGAGKSTVGGVLAARLGRRLVDSDTQIKHATGRSVREIADAQGVEEVHALERDALQSALDSDEPAVIAAAASVVDAAHTRALLRGGFVAWLEVDADTELERMQRDPTATHRPDTPEFNPDALRHLIARRNALYDEIADVAVDTTRIAPDAAADEIEAAFEAAATK